MASAHMRMKQKREKASPASKVSSPSSNASPTSAAVASPRNNNNSNDNGSGNKNHNTKKPVTSPLGRMGPDGSQLDFRQPEYQYTSPQQLQQQQQYSPHYDGNNRYQQQYHRQQMAVPSPLASSPNRPMRKDEPFDSVIQHRGNYTHHLSTRNHRSPNRLRRGYDSYTDAPKEEQETLNEQYYRRLQQAPPPPPPPPAMASLFPPPPPTTLPPQARQQEEAAFNPFAPSPLNVPNTASGNNNNDLQPRNERMSPYFHDTQLNPNLLQDENMMDGEYEYDITEEEEAYVDERKDMIAPMMKRTPVYSPNIDEEENQTISSEAALNGDPTKKKEKKSKKSSSSRSKDARYLIHNVGSDDAMDKPAAVSDPRYGIHLTTSNDDDDDVEVYEDEVSNESPNRQYNYGDIAAHAGRYAAASQPDSFAPKPNKEKTTNPFDDASSFGSKGGNLPKRIGNANSWDGGESSKSSQAVDEDNESSNVAVWDGGKKQRNMWEDDNSSTMQKFERNSKSWDQENKNSFEQNLWAGSFFGENSQSQQKHQRPNEQTLAEWDKAEAEWQNKVSPSRSKGSPEDNKLDSVMDKNYPWNTQPQNLSAAPRVYTGQSYVNMPVSDSEESDADSLFQFENKQKNSAPNDDTSSDPKEIFNKISHGLQQAGDARNVAQNVHGAESDGSTDQSETFNKFGDHGPTSPSRSVAFAGEEENKVHTYLVPRERDHSESDSGTYETRDDDDDEETDGDTLEDGDTLDNYTLDDTTYADGSTLGGTIDTRAKNDTNILDHVDHAVAAIGSAIGGLFVLANKAAANLSSENGQGNSTVGQDESTKEETNAKTVKSEYDWMGYVEKFLFPEETVSLKDSFTQYLSLSLCSTIYISLFAQLIFVAMPIVL